MPKEPEITDYFPLSVATQLAFCNRAQETNYLEQYIKQKRPVLLLAPRRYGKTSLALRAIQLSKLPYAHIDLFSAIDEQDIERLILKAIGKLLSRIESVPKRALSLANEFFNGAHIRAVLSNLEVSIDFNRTKEKPAYHVLDILERLEKLSRKTGKQLILYFDEFQSIGEITPDHAMESVLRQVAQLTKSISFIFSGSNRHLMNQLFNDRTRPFYKLCERVTLDRISEHDYVKHLSKIFLKSRRITLTDKTLNSIFLYTERHPYYINLLCSRLLLSREVSSEVIEQLWNNYVIQERSHVASEVELLSKNQKKLLTHLSRTDGVIELSGQDFIHYTKMSKATISQSMKFLENKDYVYKDSAGKYCVLDPLIKSVLSAV